jgi:glutathionylspermidine synthase
VTEVQAFRRARERFFAREAWRWPDVLADEFDMLAPFVLPAAELRAVLDAADGVARVYDATARLLRRLPDVALSELGVPAYVLPAARAVVPGMRDCVLARLDLARTPEGYRLLEFNADVPGMLVEAFSVNAVACADVGAADANAGQEAVLARALARAVRAARAHVAEHHGGQGVVTVAYRRGAWRDVGLARYVCALLADVAPRALPIDTLTLRPDGLYEPDGRRVDVLYRIFPLRGMHDTVFARDGAAEGEGRLFELVAAGRLALINPPSAFLLESKAVQALIWELFSAGEYFEPAERELVARYLLPTSLDPPESGEAYVAKPVYGGEGDTVRIVDADGAVLHGSRHTTYAGGAMIYQPRVAVPVEELMTEDGPRELHVVTSCFLVDGAAAGVCMRAGGAVTDDSAWILPVAVV